MFRFIGQEKENNIITLSEETLRHIKVTRVEEKEFVILCDGVFYLCKLENQAALIIKEMKDNNEFSGEVILAASIINLKRFEWIIQKAVELGATTFIPMKTQYTEIKQETLKNKYPRWNQIIKSATQQSFRNKFMKLSDVKSFDEVLEMNIKNKYIPYVKIKDSQYNKTTFSVNSLFMIGPEGGFSDEEYKKAISNNVIPLSLGKRILRAETASLYILSNIKDL